MNPQNGFPEFPKLEPVLNWLLNHSLQAAVLVLLVLAVQRVFRRSLTNRWRFALWWLVLVRLLLPFSPESAVSVFNFVQPKVKMEIHYTPAESATSTTQKLTHHEAIPYEDKLPAASVTPAMSDTEPVKAPPIMAKALPPATPQPVHFNAWKISAWDFYDAIIPVSLAIWLAGVLVLSGIVGMQTILFQRKLKRATAPMTGNLRMLLADCQREFGISRRIELLETDAVQSPALFGLFRLRLLLPRGLSDQFSPNELRYIFLHELAHVKRGDLWLNWLVTILQIMHWFNPLVWFGFARLRADRELACDELALLRAGDQVGTAYGETIVKLLENLNRPAAIPGLVGILEDKKQMRRRIAMIADFRKPSRWSALAIFLIVGLAAAALTDAQTSKPAAQRIKIEPDSSDTNSTNAKATTSSDPYFNRENKSPALTNSDIRPDLTGTVLTKDGATLPVSATVFIATAAPKSGSSTFCPSCYADCVKHSQTDSHGGFKIESLDPQLTFQILAVAKGFKPKYVANVDPAKESPLKIEPDPIEAAAATPARSLRGRVVDAKGAPIAGAVIDVQGIETKDGGGRWGSLPGIDPLAVTDENGEFLITSQKPFDMMSVKVSARTFANKAFTKLDSGTTVHDLVLTEGATLTGRVLLNGKPLAGISIGVSGADRTTQNFLGHFEVGTGEHGEFTFVNLPPNADYNIYGLMDTLKNFGAIPLQTIRVGKDGETTSAGDLIVGPAHRLAGRVILADGQPLPPKTRLLISRKDAWDSMRLILDENGHFDTLGIPQENITLSVRAKGYHVSTDNLSLDRLNPYRLVGRVNGDTTNLIFKLEKGPDPRPDYGNIGSDYNDSQQRPLHGVEAGVDHSQEWRISGNAFDSETKLPVKNFRVTPGQADEFKTDWNTLQTVNGTNGVYQVYVSKRTAQPLLLAEADGYLPASAAPLPGDASNVDFILQKGSGPAGTVLNPDGKPAAGATLVVLNGDVNQAGLNSAGELSAHWNKAIQCEAGADGGFSFKPSWGMKTLVAASSNGFVAISLKSFATNQTITLVSFGRISGTLKRASGPGTNEDLDVTFVPDGGALTGLDRINLSNHATTDAQGRFSFEHVPAGHLQISYRTPMKNYGSWQNNPLQTVDLKPGQSLEINIATTDRAKQMMDNSFQSPPPAKRISGEQLKGVVLLPDGKPAAAADVVLQIDGEYLALGKGKLNSNNGRKMGFMVSTGPDGSFTLPLYDRAQSVIAINEVGIVQVSLEQLKVSPQITLQKWGTISGVLQIGRHLGTNELLGLSNPQMMWGMPVLKNNSGSAIVQLPFYEPDAFKAKTDDQGRFVMTFVPPGKQKIWRRVPSGERSWTQSELATVDVKAGETLVTNIGGTGRTIIGKLKLTVGETSDLKFDTGSATEFQNGFVSISTPYASLAKIYERARNLKTDTERAAFYQSPEARSVFEERRNFSTQVFPDGTFRAEDILPGKYEIKFQKRVENGEGIRFTTFTAAQELVVPEAKDQNDESSVDWGTIELKEVNPPKSVTPAIKI